MLSKCTKNLSEEREAKLRSDEIDKQIQASAREHIVKLLLLGSIMPNLCLQDY